MGWSEEKIWDTTPRKFFAVMQCALEYAKLKNSVDDIEDAGKNGNKVKNGHVDDINW